MQFRKQLALGVMLAVFSAPGFGQFHMGKDKDKTDALREKAEKQNEKNAQTYEKIKAYSKEKYDTDPEFKDQVDKAFDDLLRQHMEEAFEHNINRGSEVVAVHEDRFRVHKGLYDNLLVQDEINRLGQSLVPVTSDRVFAFRLLPDPTPSAYTLSTGTIYISTGMVALLDSQAQLAYVLAHEMAHVELEHWKERVMVTQGADAYNNDQSKKVERIAALGGVAGALSAGLVSKNAAGAIAGGVFGVTTGLMIGELLNRKASGDWDRVQEDEADKMAFKVMLDARYDPREVPKVYNTLEAVTNRDRRATLGFLGDRNRVRERRENAQKLIAEAYKAEIESGLKRGYIGDTAKHRNLMAELKRDNGIMAYYNDMFDVARKNLADAVATRDNDAEAQYFYGKVLETIGRTDDDHKLALQSFQKAAQYDIQKRNFGAHLHYALALMDDEKSTNPAQVSAALDDYIAAWFKYLPEDRKRDYLPPSIDSIYDYMALYGTVDWKPKLPAELDAMQVNYELTPRNLQQLTNTMAQNAAAGSSTPKAKTGRTIPTNLPTNIPSSRRQIPGAVTQAVQEQMQNHQ